MIAENIARIRSRMEAACARAGRAPSEVTLIAVAKTFPAEMIREAVAAGVLDVGENYVQEMLRKQEAPGLESVRWHFIGHLQSNKVKAIVPRVAMIHAVDSVDLAREIDRRGTQAGSVMDVLVEVNTTGEQSKHGVRPGDTLPLISALKDFGALRIAGLMTIGPFLPDPEGSRPMFRRLRELSQRAAELRQPNVEMRHLSMGMTGDFEVAIEEGATMVRLGTAVFGARPKPL